MTKRFDKWVRSMNDEQLHAFCETIEIEMQRRAERSKPRGRIRSTYMGDLVRGPQQVEPTALPWAA